MLIDAKSSVRKQILRELDITHECNSEYIISCYGSFIEDPNICTCIEFMDKGSFDGIYKNIGALPVEVVGRVAMSVLEGLTYLYDVHRIIHRGTWLASTTRRSITHCFKISNLPTFCSTRKDRSSCATSVSPENSSIPSRTPS